MKPQDFTGESPGQLVPITEGGVTTVAFVPAFLPRQLNLSPRTLSRLTAAEQAIGRLDGSVGRRINPYLIARPLLRREALISSRMEGTKTTAARLVSLEANAETNPDAETREVRNYMLAMEHGLSMMRELPVCLRVIRAVHQTLLEGVRGERENPGKFRTVQNFIGHAGLADARFVPPPPRYLDRLLDDLEAFLNDSDEDALPLLIRLAMSHYQFEAIHPFGDGNGRVGRLLLPLSLHSEKYLSQPTLYVSSCFERSKRMYADLMLSVSQTGAWEPWIQFFLEGLTTAAMESESQANALSELRASYHERLHQARNSALLQKLVDSLFDTPLLTAARIQQLIDVSPATSNKHLRRLVDMDIVSEITGRSRGRKYVAAEVLRITEADEAE